jgi:hypothetical protein
VLVPDYGATWIEERPGLRPKTVLIYGGLLRSHIEPYFENDTGMVTLGMICADGRAGGSRARCFRFSLRIPRTAPLLPLAGLPMWLYRPQHGRCRQQMEV